MLPRAGERSVKLNPVSDWVLDKASRKEKLREVTCQEVEDKLSELGLRSFEVDLVMARIVEGWRFAEVCDKQGWVSTRSASYHLRNTVGKIRRKGLGALKRGDT